MLVLLGNSPSSGSTLLSELLDSTPLSMSGEELGLFANKKFYLEHTTAESESSFSKSVYVSRNGLFNKGLSSYGLTRRDVSVMLSKANSPKNFVELFHQHFKEFRNKEADIWFEKTPQNLTCISEFLEMFPDSFFIHIVRNPLHVYSSLIKRGYPEYIALCTWLIDVASFFRYRNHNRVLCIKYEDLLEKPYDIVSDVLRIVSGSNLVAEDIERCHQQNTYRERYTIKIDSWSASSSGKVNKDVNKKEIDRKTLSSFSTFKNLSISKNYAEKFGIERVSYAELVKFFGYDELLDLDSAKQNKKSLRDYKYLASKYWHDMKNGDCKLHDLLTYMSPVEVL